MMNVLVACEESAIVRDAFRARGHNAWSCDILPCAGDTRWHVRGNVLDHLMFAGSGERWDLMIAHPPCTYLALCQAWRCGRDPERAKLRAEAVEFAKMLWNADIPKICLENPKSQLSTMMAPKSQTIHPWQFGHEEMKETWLWLKGLPKLQPTSIVGPPPPKDSPGRKQWEKVWRMSPGPERSKLRSRTYQGMADAMAEQWGSL